MATRVITMLWSHFAFQFTRPANLFVQILKVLRPIPPLIPYAAKGAGGIEQSLFVITRALVPISVGLMANQVITMLWGHFALQSRFLRCSSCRL